MKKAEILAVCSNDGILKTILRLINNNEEWHATGAVNADEAIALFNTKASNLVLIGSGLDIDSEQELVSFLNNHAHKVPVIKHYGGGSGLLFGEIQHALAGRQNII